jgi:hypothetical protein
MRRVLRFVAFAVGLIAVCTGGYLLYRGNYGEPREDPGSKTGFYIPSDLDDALGEVDRIMGRRGRNQVLSLRTEDDMIGEFHFGLGQWMRNNWGLWGGSRLSNYFNDLGVHHPDDMSDIILDSYWRKLHDQPIDLDGQVLYYKQYWQNATQ